MSTQSPSQSRIETLSVEELEKVSGGATLGPNGLAATGGLEAMSVLDGSRGKVMVIVDGVIMNKDELGMI